ncbi:hypothetical protein [Leptolyngbya sp. CCY15150]|uniref:hypothetical protein n=1 Tax=Leptolyngbya sp. CCY15150 TaxID=2767772 RepID=UPI00195075BA|nr:hypothetical protein [Leptolyngbya sp. CCY15150]
MTPQSSVLHRLEHAASTMRDVAIARAAIASRDLLIRTAQHSGCPVYAVTTDDILDHLETLRHPPTPEPSVRTPVTKHHAQRSSDDFERSLDLLGNLFGGVSLEAES